MHEESDSSSPLIEFAKFTFLTAGAGGCSTVKLTSPLESPLVPFSKGYHESWVFYLIWSESSPRKIGSVHYRRNWLCVGNVLRTVLVRYPEARMAPTVWSPPSLNMHRSRWMYALQVVDYYCCSCRYNVVDEHGEAQHQPNGLVLV